MKLYVKNNNRITQAHAIVDAKEKEKRCDFAERKMGGIVEKRTKKGKRRWNLQNKDALVLCS